MVYTVRRLKERLAMLPPEADDAEVCFSELGGCSSNSMSLSDVESVRHFPKNGMAPGIVILGCWEKDDTPIESAGQS